MEDSFYIVAWAYYCRQGCHSHFAGWNKSLISSLPAYLRLAFPAVLSHKGGLFNNVITQLRVGNQHKMGPSGVRSLLLEMHILKFNIRLAQYTEAVFQLFTAHEKEAQATNILYAYMARKVPSFGNFSDPQRYAGFVPSEHYLAEMMNKVIEVDERDANQHTSCLAVDQIAIDDSHKVLDFIYIFLDIY